MRSLKQSLTASVLALGLSAFSFGAAHAALVISGSVGGAPTGVTKENFDTLPLGTGGGLMPSGITVAFTPSAQAVSGSASGLYAAPFLSGGNGMGFGPGGTDQADGADTTVYITSGSTGATAGAVVELTFSTPQMYFGLLWGSVDDYNKLEFYDGATLVGTATGIDVTAAPNGDQGINGTLYVNIDSSLAFNRVVATSTNFAFEFDNVAFNATPIPEPATLALLGTGLLGLGFLRRRRSNDAVA